MSQHVSGLGYWDGCLNGMISYSTSGSCTDFLGFMVEANLAQDVAHGWLYFANLQDHYRSWC